MASEKLLMQPVKKYNILNKSPISMDVGEKKEVARISLPARRDDL